MLLDEYRLGRLITSLIISRHWTHIQWRFSVHVSAGFGGVGLGYPAERHPVG